MKAFVVFVAVWVGQTSFADGFRCEGLIYKQRLVVYNNTQPKLGTRVAAILIASDPKLKGRNKTIATFKKVQGLLTSSSTVYTADVDSRFTSVGRTGENIAGTKLGYLKTIKLAVNFSYQYNAPSSPNEKFTALAKYIKENGSVTSENMVCDRYVKGY
ncbi:MAG: hypothetical protein JST80_00050 [Bdellovibrionales bacterium]|nr:hypothetical protein [Bdellovibrionales bacterium]